MSGTSILVDPGTTAQATAVATDNIGGTNYQIVKLDVGASGASSPFTGTLAQVNTIGTLPNLPGGSIAVTTGTLNTLGTVGTIQNLAGGTVATNILSGTVTNVGSVVGMGSLTNIGTLGTILGIGGTVQTAGTFSANVNTRSTDYYPMYNRRDLGGGNLSVDPAGALVTRGAVTTDEGAAKANFTGTSIAIPIGTATFLNGSSSVAGTGFSTNDSHYLDYVKLNADTEASWAQIAFINSDTSYTLFSNYAGAGGTGLASFSPVAPSTGSGGTITVASGQLTLGLGTVTAATTMVSRGASDGNMVAISSLSVSQRIINQDIYFGIESSTTSPFKAFSRFHFTGSTNTQVLTETGWNPTGAPTSSESQFGTITLPAGGNTGTANLYKIEQSVEAITFTINNTIVATHTLRIPHVNSEGDNAVSINIRGLNGGTAPASNTNVIVDYIYGKNYDRIDTYQSSLGSIMITDSNGAIVSTTNNGLNTNILSGTLNAGTVSVNTQGTIASGSIVVTAGTIVGTVTTNQNSGTLNVGTINSGTLNAGTINSGTINAGTINSGTIRNDGRPARNILSFGTTISFSGSAFATLVGSASIGAGTSLWVNDISIVNNGGTVTSGVMFGSNINGSAVLAKGNFGANGGIQKSFPMPVNAGMTNFDLNAWAAGAGTIDFVVSYFISA